MTPKQKYIGKYLDRRMKNHKLPYGMQYLSLLASMEEKAICSNNGCKHEESHKGLCIICGEKFQMGTTTN